MAQTEIQFPRTFYWFDFETFGLDPKRDRPAQFAGLRTDENLNQIGKPDVLYCQLSEDYLPDPGACLVTGITPMTCMEQGVTEAEFAKKIYALFSEPMTISIGYNNFKFDDEVVRHMFWRNLLEPYKREWDQGCARMDLYGIVQALYAFKPNSLVWPKDADGKLSLRLEELTKANGLTHSNPHDAASDAISTMLLAKLIKQKEPKFWIYALALTDKKLLKTELSKPKPYLYVSRWFGEDKKFLTTIFPLRANPNRSNEWFCWDLSYDPSELLNLTLDDIKTRVDSTGEDRLPFIRLKLGTSPFIVPLPKSYNDKFAPCQKLTYEQVFERANVIAKADLSIMDSFFVELAEAEEKKFARTDEDIETSLYSTGFLNIWDRDQLEKLRNMTPADIADRFNKTQFLNEELPGMIRRYVARNFPEYLAAEDEKIWQKYKTDHLINGKDQARTFNQFFEAVNKKLKECPQEKDLLKELYEYGQELYQQT